MTTHVDIIKAIAREDATVNDEAPFAECAVDTWYTDSVDAATRLGASDPMPGVIDPRDIVAAVDALGRFRAYEIYHEEWEKMEAKP